MGNVKILAGLIVLLVVIVAAGSFLFQNYEDSYEESRFEDSKDMMDTYVNIAVYSTDEETANNAINAAFERMDEVVLIASRFDETSELYQLNSNGVIENPSNELKDMIETCIDYYDITGGAFDITILPLLNLWSDDKYLFSMNSTYAFDLDNNTISNGIKSEFKNFEPSLNDLNETPVLSLVDSGWEIKSSWQTYYLTNETNEIKVYTKFWYLPSTTQDTFINETKELVGSNKITITDNSISLENGMSITLDGMAKGYAVDEAVKVLKAHGIAAGLVDAGGDIATFGTKPGNEKWITGLRNPQDTSESIMEFGLSDMAIATSGNYERYFDENATVGHIMDPITGRTVSKCSSSTIIAGSCTIADILATSVFVKGTVDGIDLANSLADVEAVVLGYDDPQETFTSSGLENFVIEN